MPNWEDILTEQIKRAVGLTGSAWAVAARLGDEGWTFDISYKVSKKIERVLIDFVNSKGVSKFFEGVEKEGQVKSKKTGKWAEDLGVEKVWAFGTSSGLVLLIGNDDLGKIEKGLFQNIALGVRESRESDLLGKLYYRSKDKNTLVFEKDNQFKSVFQNVSGLAEESCGMVLVYRSGQFEIVAVSKGNENILGKRIETLGNSKLNEMINLKQGKVFEGEIGVEEFDKIEGRLGGKWVISPLLVGERLLGVLAYNNKDFKEAKRKKLDELAEEIVPGFETEVILLEASRFLRRFTVLEELASVIVKGASIEELGLRIRTMIQRNFNAHMVSFYLLDTQEDVLNEFVMQEGDDWNILPLDSTIEGSVIRIGQAVRIDNIAKQTKYSSLHPDVLSKLVVPMRFRGELIGVISLESYQAGSFTNVDEEVMAAVASQMAGILENARLNIKTDERASNLRKINDIVQEVVGLKEPKEIAESAAREIADRFGHELVMVMLLDEKMEEFVADGLGGIGAEGFPKGLRYGSQLGIPGELMQTGKSILLPDVELSDSYIKIPDWEPGSQMCVPMREGEEIMGLISVEYQTKGMVTEVDLEVLEALAAVLSSVILYALKYEQLEKNVDQLEVVRQTALDISSDLDLNVMLKRAVNRVRELLNARGAELGLVDEGQKAVRIIVSENPWKDYSGYTFPLMSGVTGKIAAAGEPVVVPDFISWGGKEDEGQRSSFTTVAGVPLKLSGEVIGTLVVQDDRPDRSFTVEDMKVLELLSPQLSIFIRNARLYQELEERIEAQRLAESRLIQSAKLAAVGEMAAGVAHELNNPLTTVTGFAELILDSMPKDSTEYEDMALILQEAHRARSVVRQLLDFSRQSDILRVNLDINEVLSGVLGLIHHQAQTSKVEIRIEFWDGLPLVRVDRNQMQQVFLNLIHNAIQAMTGGGELVVQSLVDQREGEDWILVKVRDNGEGIDDEVMGKIFEPFFTTKESGQGTGLGLSVSYGIVSDHGGYIEVESEPGKGTTFMVWLPVEIPLIEESEQINV